MKALRGSILLLLATFIWGSTFVAQSKGMDYIGPYTYNAARFTVGFLVLIPFSISSVRKHQKDVPDKKEYVTRSIKAGLLIGIPLIVASTFQQVAIVYSSAAKAGFITAMYIIFVPILGKLLKKPVDGSIWICVLISMTGFYLLSFDSSFTLNIYDLLLLLCALSFAVEILGIDMLNDTYNDVMVSCMMFFTCSVVSIVLAPIFETIVIKDVIRCYIPILYAGVLSCGVAYTFQVMGQKDLDPSIASLLMSLESVFATITGYVVLKETLIIREALGCLLIFTSVILSQSKDIVKYLENKKKEH